MKITANIATYPPRLDSLDKVVKSLYTQVDEIRICFNEMKANDIPSQYVADGIKIKCFCPEENLTDNGKFWGLDNIDEPEYYFTCDDDIIYPPDYVNKTLEFLQKHESIISYHGRVLERPSNDYYTDHKAYRMFGKVDQDIQIDVCSTGVMAFDTRYFHPKGLAGHELLRMSDLTFSLEAIKEYKQIMCCAHDIGWLRPIVHDENIYHTESSGPMVNQNKYATQIYRIKYGAE